MVHFDFHIPPSVKNVGARFDKHVFQNYLRKAEVQAIIIFGKDHNGQLYHLSEVGHRHTHLTRDLFGEMAVAAREIKIKVLCYYSLGIDNFVVNQHPDWAFQPIDGSLAEMLQVYRPVCYNSPYGEKVFKPHIMEITRRYEIDGFWYDGSAWCFSLPCVCRFCREKFTRETGCDLPTSFRDKDYPLLKDWYLKSIKQFLQCAVDLPLKVNKDYLVTHNWYSSYHEPALPLARMSHLSGDISFSYPVLEASLAGRFFATQGLSYDILYPRMQNSWIDDTVRPTAQLKQECAVILATGAKSFLADKPYPDGRLDPTVWRSFREVNLFIKKRERYCRSQKAISDIAILQSEWNMFAWSDRLFNPPGYIDKIRGAHKIVVESGRHCLIYEEALLARNIDNLRLVILPDQEIMEARTYNAIYHFVQEGGTAILTNNTFWKMKNSKDLACPVKDFLGFEKIKELDYPYGYISDPAFSVTPIFVDRRFSEVRPTTGKVLATIYRSDAPVGREDYFFSVWKSPPERDTYLPAVVWNKVGKGRVITFTADIFSAYWEYNNPAIKNYVSYLIEKYVGRTLIEVSDPGVEVALFQIKGGYRVHLVNTYGSNRISPGNQVVERIPLVKGLKIRVSLPHPKEVRLLGKRNGRLKVQDTKQFGFVITLPELELYEIMELSY